MRAIFILSVILTASPAKVEEVPRDTSPVHNNTPSIEALDASWFATQITNTSQASLLALTSGQQEIQEIQNQISTLRNETNKSKTLSAHLDLRVDMLRIFGRISFAFNELLQYRKRYKDTENQTPTALDAYKVSLNEWREQRKKRIEAEWSNRKGAIETEINNLTHELVMRYKDKNLEFDPNDSFVIAAQNIRNTANKIKTSHEQAEAARELARLSKFQDIEVIQVLPNGILADPLNSVNRSSSLTQLGGGGPGVYSHHLSGRIVYVDGLSGMAEGQRALISYLEDGVFTFEDINGASRTVPKWKFIRNEEENNTKR